jgi:hypothetical protein
LTRRSVRRPLHRRAFVFCGICTLGREEEEKRRTYLAEQVADVAAHALGVAVARHARDELVNLCEVRVVWLSV